MTHADVLAAEPKMQRSVDAMEREFTGVRTGRASTAMVERILVEYYGTPTPLNRIAGISTPDPHLIVIQPPTSTARSCGSTSRPSPRSGGARW